MEKLTVAIQAGGKSSRMGRDKSFVRLGGRPLIEIVRDRVAPLADELLLVTNDPPDYAHLGLRIVSDRYPDHGPLGGMETALFHAAHADVLMVACDMPWLNVDLLRYMVGLREVGAEPVDIIVPRWGKFPEPLHAIYNKRCLPAITANLAAQRLKITGFFGRMRVRYVEREEIERFDMHGRSFANVNTPDQLEAVRRESPPGERKKDDRS